MAVAEFTGGWVLTRGLSLTLLIFTLFSSQAFALVERYTDHVTIGRDLRIKGSYLCHDGAFLYFQDPQDCIDHNKAFKHHFDLQLKCNDKPLGAIRQIEKIILDEKKSVHRFFQVDTSFKVKDYEVFEDGRRQLIGEFTHEVGFCENRPIQEPLNQVASPRSAIGQEKMVLGELYKRGITIINSPQGIIRGLTLTNKSVRKLNLDDIFTFANIRTPQCALEESKDLLLKAGGEFTGNGIHGFNLDLLQKASEEILRKQVSPGTNQFHYYCADPILI